MPNPEYFRRRFGGLNQARMAAGIPIIRHVKGKNCRELDHRTGKEITYDEWLEKYGNDLLKEVGHEKSPTTI